jgi:hypothetical protein
MTKARTSEGVAAQNLSQKATQKKTTQMTLTQKRKTFKILSGNARS